MKEHLVRLNSFVRQTGKWRAEDELSMPSMVSRSQSANATCSGYETDPNDMSQLLSLISQSIDNANKSEEARVNDEEEETTECSITVTPQPQMSQEVEKSWDHPQPKFFGSRSCSFSQEYPYVD